MTIMCDQCETTSKAAPDREILRVSVMLFNDDGNSSDNGDCLEAVSMDLCKACREALWEKLKAILPAQAEPTR